MRFNSVLRQLIHAGTRIADLAYSPGDRKANEILDEAERRVFAIAEQLARGGGFRDSKSLVATALERIDRLYNSGERITGLPTGFTDFDERTSGLQQSDLIIVAGRPSMGKTAFAMNIVAHVALEKRRPVAVFSLEMPGEALILRMLSSGRIDQHRVRSGQLQEGEWPHELREISAISRSLKSLARELDIPVIALSQLNRSLEQRPNKRPIMSDLRESGAIEQDADLIAFIYRDEVYNEDSPDRGSVEIIIAKQRNGPIGTMRMTFLGQYTRFEDYISDRHSDPGY